jgi:hypothetical protein
VALILAAAEVEEVITIQQALNTTEEMVLQE